MIRDEIPIPPVLSSDSKRCDLSFIKRKIMDDFDKYESKTPKDLPGRSKKYITPDSFFPYDESSTKSGGIGEIGDPSPLNSPTASSIINERNGTNERNEREERTERNEREERTERNEREERTERNERNDDSTISNQSSEPVEDLLPPDISNISRTPISKTAMSDRERTLAAKKFIALKTFVFHDDSDVFNLVQFRTYYGNIFFIRLNRTGEVTCDTMGEEKISLFLNTDPKTSLFVISDSMTKYVKETKNMATLINDSIIYNGKLYSVANLSIHNSHKSFHPSSYLVYDEKYLDDIKDLSISVQVDSYSSIESVYRNELKTYYNKILDKLTDFSERIQNHHDVFKHVDNLLIHETDIYYDSFAEKYKTINPVPVEEDIKRITFLNENVTKYVQSHFILWGRINEKLESFMNEFEETIDNIYLQNIKDFPDIEEDIPISPDIDIENSYPGKLVRKI